MKYGAQVAAVELHALDDVEFVLQGLAVLDRDHAFLADFSMAVAMILPMSPSELAEIEPT